MKSDQSAIFSKKVKIVATLGPSSDTKPMILALAKKGVDVFRLNLSHYKSDKAREVVTLIREVETLVKRPLAIMGDLAGPKIRIGDIEPGAVLQRGQSIEIIKKRVTGNSKRFSLNYPAILDRLEKGAEVYIGDGIIKLQVEKRISEGVQTRVLIGGELLPKKGFSAHGLSLAHFELSKKDKDDIVHMVAAGVDALAVSFVQHERDIAAVRKLLPARSPIMLIAKMETSEAIKNAEGIIDEADGIMVARGDLGFTVPMAEIPHVQKRLISLALQKSKPVITATQMLESMIFNPLPTRAEVTDVANAILDGTDAVMLSQETAMGKFPEEVVATMVQIIERAIQDITPRMFPEERSISDAISASAVHIADRIRAKAIFVFTQKGVTARRISRHRHGQAIIALTPEAATLRNLSFSWGVYPFLVPVVKQFSELSVLARKLAKKNPVCGFTKGEPFVISAGVPFGRSGGTNLISVERV